MASSIPTTPKPYGVDTADTARLYAALYAKVASKHTSESTVATAPFHAGLTYPEAVALLKASSYKDGECGDPGTIILISPPSPTAAKGRFDAYIVNEQGELFMQPVTKNPDGSWSNGAKGKTYPTYQVLVDHLFESLKPYVGDSFSGIQFFTPAQFQAATELMEKPEVEVGTYICVAHPPLEADSEGPATAAGASVAATELPGKRNILLLKTPEGVKIFHFHSERTRGIIRWFNGGPERQMDTAAHEGEACGHEGETGGSSSPVKGLRRAEVANDSTLMGLIHLKAAEHCGTAPVRPLELI